MAISASAVRQAVHDGRLEDVRCMLPDTTWNYLTGTEGQAAVTALRASDNVVHH